jgi:hypothetical protein
MQTTNFDVDEVLPHIFQRGFVRLVCRSSNSNIHYLKHLTSEPALKYPDSLPLGYHARLLELES